jgi:hypothetical protein
MLVYGLREIIAWGNIGNTIQRTTPQNYNISKLNVLKMRLDHAGKHY